MFELRRTQAFASWQSGLRDTRALERIAQRLVRVQHGHLGDVKSVGGKVRELRIDHGPGYRVYFMQQGDTIILLLCGGDKSSQRRDITRAIAMAEVIGAELIGEAI
jgi:putative addiction module killer protein